RIRSVHPQTSNFKWSGHCAVLRASPIRGEPIMKVRLNLLWTSTIVVALVIFCVGGLVAATIPHYVITNNDNSQGNAAGFYTISGGSLTPAALVKTGGTGIDGIGSVATKRVSVLRNSTQSCVFISDAGTNDIAGISVTSLTLAGRFK